MKNLFIVLAFWTAIGVDVFVLSYQVMEDDYTEAVKNAPFARRTLKALVMMRYIFVWPVILKIAAWRWWKDNIVRETHPSPNQLEDRCL